MDPENDRYTVLWVRGEYNVIEKAQVFARVGLLRRFIAEPGESGYFLQDTTLGGRYGHEISLEGLKLGERKLSLSHQVLLYLPTSRASLLQTLRLAPELRSTASIDVVKGLSVGVQGRFQYRFHRYAERAGPGAGMNTQYLLGVLPSVSYTLPELGELRPTQRQRVHALDVAASIRVTGDLSLRGERGCAAVPDVRLGRVALVCSP